MSRTKGSRALLPADANAAARRAQALELRVAGLTQAEIAERIGVGQPRVSRMIRQALAERTAAGVDDLRAIETERLDSLHAAFWPQAITRKDVGAGHLLVKVADRRGKLLGLDQAGEGGAVLHDYQVMAMIHVSGEASAELARWEAEQAADVAWMQREGAALPPTVVANTRMPLPPNTTAEGAIEAVTGAVAQAIGPRPPTAPPLEMRLIILRCSYRPSSGMRSAPEPVHE